MSLLHIERDPSSGLAHLSSLRCEGYLKDPVGKEGATRLLLRLLRRSVRGFEPEQLDEEVDRLGGYLGTELNRSCAGYSAAVLSRNQGRLLSLLEKVLLEPAFDEAEFERLKSETRAEWIDSLDDDSLLVRRYFGRAVFDGHEYARLGAGTPHSLENIELSDLRDLHHKLILETPVINTFSGDVDPESCEAFSSSISEATQNGAVHDPLPPHPTGPSGRHLVFVDKPERTQTQIMIGGRGTFVRDEDHTALYVANTVFGGTFTSRLSQEVRGKRGWSYGASSHLPFDRLRHAFSMWTFPATKDAAACIALQLNLLETLIERGVTAKELAAAKRYLKNSYAFSLDTPAKRASKWTDSQIYDLPPDYFDGYLDRVAGVSREDIAEAVKRRLSAEDLVIVVVGTKDPLLDELKTQIPRLRSTRIVAYDCPD